VPAARIVTHEAWSADSVSSMAAIINATTPRYSCAHATQSRSHDTRASSGELEFSSSAGTISSDRPKGWTAEKLAVALGKAGVLGHAEQLIATITTSRARAVGTRRISGVIARGGEYDRVEQLARNIKRSWHRMIAMADLSGVLTRAGRHDHAEEVARTIVIPWCEPEFLVISRLR
jgi:hypothetical protein